jgi:glutathione S-transferase
MEAGVAALLERKLGLIREVFATTQQELLLVNLAGLTPLLERKQELIGEVARIDEALAEQGAPPQETPQQEEIAEVVRAILENERTLEARINEERSQLREEMRELDRQTRLREYLERQKQTESRIDIKK